MSKINGYPVDPEDGDPAGSPFLQVRSDIVPGEHRNVTLGHLTSYFAKGYFGELIVDKIRFDEHGYHEISSKTVPLLEQRINKLQEKVDSLESLVVNLA